MQMVANFNVLLAGRFIGGLGVGASSMLSPQFLGTYLYIFDTYYLGIATEASKVGIVHLLTGAQIS